MKNRTILFLFRYHLPAQQEEFNHWHTVESKQHDFKLERPPDATQGTLPLEHNTNDSCGKELEFTLFNGRR